MVSNSRSAARAEVAQIVLDKRKLLYHGHDDLLTFVQSTTLLFGAIGVAKDRGYMVVPFDGSGYLRIECAPVGDDDDKIELGGTAFAGLLELYQLMSQPEKVVALAAASECWIR